MVKLPSGKIVSLPSRCRATIGIVAGAGRIEKPFLRAGRKWHWMMSKGRYYPRVRGVAMNPVDHPFGGGAHQHPGKPTLVKRTSPPGKKVGLIAASRTGKGRGRRRRRRRGRGW
jgi:large subunit ribosomal protein L2